MRHVLRWCSQRCKRAYLQQIDAGIIVANSSSARSRERRARDGATLDTPCLALDAKGERAGVRAAGSRSSRRESGQDGFEQVWICNWIRAEAATRSQQAAHRIARTAALQARICIPKYISSIEYFSVLILYLPSPTQRSPSTKSPFVSLHNTRAKKDKAEKSPKPSLRNTGIPPHQFHFHCRYERLPISPISLCSPFSSTNSFSTSTPSPDRTLANSVLNQKSSGRSFSGKNCLLLVPTTRPITPESFCLPAINNKGTPPHTHNHHPAETTTPSPVRFSNEMVLLHRV
jgi:hypothetical protein